MASVQGSDSSWVGRKPLRQLGGMSDALTIAADLGFSVHHPPSQNLSSGNGEKDDDFVRVLRELTAVQRKISDLQVELQGRKEDKNVAHLTHVSEMERKIETLARITTILKGVIQNKDRIIARLQQPYSIDCLHVEPEYQKQFSELIMNAASDYGTLMASVSDLQWTLNFKEPPSVWGEMLRPIPVALKSCARYFGAMTAMRESFATLQKLRSCPSRLPSKDPSRRTSPTDSECVSPCSSGTGWNSDDLDHGGGRMQGIETQKEEDDENTNVDDTTNRRLSWPSGNENGL